MSSSLLKKIALWLSIFVLLGMVWYFIVSSGGSSNEYQVALRGSEPGFAQVLQASDESLHPIELSVSEGEVGALIGNRLYTASLPPGIELANALMTSDINIPDSFYSITTAPLPLRGNATRTHLEFHQPDAGFVQIVALWTENITTDTEGARELAPIEITVSNNDVTAMIGSATYQTNIEDGFQLLAYLSENVGDANTTTGGYNYTVNTPGFLSGLLNVGLSLLPVIIIVGVLLFFLRQAQGGGSQAMNFGRSRAKPFEANLGAVTFKDVAGLAEAKEELAEIVDFLKFPDKFRALGARIPKGVLLVGPPGTGKTLVSRAVAGEAGVPFFSISGSEFVEMFVGVGASRVRDMFNQAKKQSPCIIFIDEIDAVGRQRGAGVGGGHDEREQTLNQILVEMDGFDSGTNVIILAATNRPDILDPALVRPGRFDRRVILDAPDRRGREEIIGVHAKGKPFNKDVNFEALARQTPGFSGADLANLVNEAALLTARSSKSEIGMQELTEAIDRVSIGPARKSRVMTQKDREITAYHETGHALVAHFMPAGPNVGKISITARGHAGGFTRYQQEDATYHTLDEFEALVASAMGGRVAEEYKFGSFTTGSSSDIENATKMARSMVTRYGMSKVLGARTYGKREESVFLGRDMSEQRDYSLESEAKIDEEINQILSDGIASARKIMEEHSDTLELVAKYLLEHETLEADEFTALLNGDLPVKAPAASESTEPTAVTDQSGKDATTETPPQVNNPKPALGLSN